MPWDQIHVNLPSQLTTGYYEMNRPHFLSKDFTMSQNEWELVRNKEKKIHLRMYWDIERRRCSPVQAVCVRLADQYRAEKRVLSLGSLPVWDKQWHLVHFQVLQNLARVGTSITHNMAWGLSCLSVAIIPPGSESANIWTRIYILTIPPSIVQHSPPRHNLSSWQGISIIKCWIKGCSKEK